MQNEILIDDMQNPNISEFFSKLKNPSLIRLVKRKADENFDESVKSPTKKVCINDISLKNPRIVQTKNRYKYIYYFGNFK